MRASSLDRDLEGSMIRNAFERVLFASRFLLAPLYLALAIFIFALARPQLGKSLTEVEASGIDIMVVLDVSGSMEETDLQPNRLDAAKAVNASAGGGIDDVIDPADTRSWIVNSLRRLPVVPKRQEKKYPCIDTW